MPAVRRLRSGPAVPISMVSNSKTIKIKVKVPLNPIDENAKTCGPTVDPDTERMDIDHKNGPPQWADAGKAVAKRTADVDAMAEDVEPTPSKADEAVPKEASNDGVQEADKDGLLLLAKAAETEASGMNTVDEDKKDESHPLTKAGIDAPKEVSEPVETLNAGELASRTSSPNSRLRIPDSPSTDSSPPGASSCPLGSRPTYTYSNSAYTGWNPSMTNSNSSPVDSISLYGGSVQLPKRYRWPQQPLVLPNIYMPLFPAPAILSNLLTTYISALHPSKQTKAILMPTLFGLVRTILENPEANPLPGNAQLRFWARRQFMLSAPAFDHPIYLLPPEFGYTADDLALSYLSGLPLAPAEFLWWILSAAHSVTEHGGRDKTVKEVGRWWAGVPKEVVAAYVKACPGCQKKRMVKKATPTRNDADPDDASPAIATPSSTGPSAPVRRVRVVLRKPVGLNTGEEQVQREQYNETDAKGEETASEEEAELGAEVEVIEDKEEKNDDLESEDECAPQPRQLMSPRLGGPLIMKIKRTR